MASMATNRPERRPALPKVSVIVPVYNDKKRLRACVEALHRQSYGGPLEIIVIDNGSTDGVADLATTFPSMIFLQESQAGAYAARNTGLIHATGDVFAFTDSDCLPDVDWLTLSVRGLLASDRVGFVGGHIRIALDIQHASLAELYDLFTAFPQESYVKALNFAATANMVTTRAMMERVGTFDASLRSGGDREWCNRAVAAGYGAVYEARAVVSHPARQSAEILKKVKRVSAGTRYSKPESLWGLKQLFHMLVPPVRELSKVGLWGERGELLSAWQKCKVFFFAWRVRCYRARTVVWYHVTNAEAPRA
jgi:glycosyltransferase involved in cell wall biosynthesis